MKPLVSICIPTFNGEKFLQEALNSIEEQAYDNIEVIVSDDQSSDDTWQIIEAYSSKSRFPVTLIKHKPTGIGSNWNNCIRHANGTYIKFLFQDDVLTKDCILEMVKALDCDKTLISVACQRSFKIENSESHSKWIEKYGFLQAGFNKNKNERYRFNTNHLSKKEFFQSPLNKIGEPSAVLFRKDAVNKIGDFDEQLEQILDYVYWYKLLTIGDILILPQKLVTFRLHNGQATQKNVRDNKDEGSAYRYFIYSTLRKFISHEHYRSLRNEFHPLWRLKNRLLKLIIRG